MPNGDIIITAPVPPHTPVPNPYQKGDEVEYQLSESGGVVNIGYYSYRSGKTDYVIPYHCYKQSAEYTVATSRILQKLN